MSSNRRSLAQILFGSKKSTDNVSGAKPRRLRLEDLERRELLDVSTADYQAIAEASSAAALSSPATEFEPIAFDG